MIPEYIPAVSALAGSMIGGVTSLTAAWLTQSHQATAERLTQEKTRRQKLYKDFIEETSRLYADALGHSKAEISDFVKVYALISRMRVLSNMQTIEKADRVVKMIVDTYFAPNKTLTEFARDVEQLRHRSITRLQRNVSKRTTKPWFFCLVMHQAQFARLDLFPAATLADIFIALYIAR